MHWWRCSSSLQLTTSQQVHCNLNEENSVHLPAALYCTSIDFIGDAAPYWLLACLMSNQCSEAPSLIANQRFHSRTLLVNVNFNLSIYKEKLFLLGNFVAYHTNVLTDCSSSKVSTLGTELRHCVEHFSLKKNCLERKPCVQNFSW